MEQMSNSTIKDQTKIPKMLMAVSMVMLIAFFAFWLNQSYLKQKDWLRKEVFYLFSESIHAIQDSLATKLMAQQLEKAKMEGNIGSESIEKQRKQDGDQQKNIYVSVDSIRLDTNIHILLTAESKPDQKITFHLKTEDQDKATTPGKRNRYGGPMHRRSFNRLRMINFNGDSVKIDSLQLLNRFESNVKNAAIPLAVSIETLALEEEWDSQSEQIKTFPIPTGYPSDIGYRGVVSDHRLYLVSKIWPEMVVTAALLLIVMFSFLVILRNLTQQQRLNILKNDLISNITHELKTPVATVSIAIEALQHFSALENKEKTKDYLQMAQSELQRLSILIDRVLKTSLFEQSRISLDLEPLNLKEIVKAAGDAMKIPMEKKMATCVSNIDEAITVYGDSSHLTNVLVNLLDNAIKYNPGRPNIEITAEDRAAFIQITISDDGPGIPLTYQDKVFDRFFRVPSGDLHNIKGSGLGLSYVKDVVEKHGGSIKLAKSTGSGTSFVIQLPKHETT